MDTTEVRTTRYTRNRPTISEVRTWTNDGYHMAHSTPRCPKMHEPRRITAYDRWARTTTGPKPLGWICAHCTADDPQPEDPPVSKRGTATCEGCARTLPVTKFQTVRYYGYQVRDTRVCRECRKGGFTPVGDPELGSDPLARPSLGPDYRPVRTETGRIMAWVHVPGSSARGWRADHPWWDIPDPDDEGMWPPPVWDTAVA